MEYNVFNTQAEAQLAQDDDYQEYRTVRHTCGHEDFVAECACCRHLDTTTRWADVRQRSDGKWVFEVCPESIAPDRTIETKQEDWGI